MKKVRDGYKMTELGEIPSEWEVKNIGEVAKFQGGYAFKSSDYVEDGIRLVKITNVQQKNISWNEEDLLPVKYLEKFNEYKLQEDDVVIAMTRPIISTGIKVCKIEKRDLPCLLNQRVGRFIIKDSLISKYLYNYCFTDYFINKVKELCSTTGQPNISANQIESILITIPSVKEQEKIAAILSTVDEQIDNVDALIEKNKELKKGLMQTLLTKGIGHTKFKKTEIGEIPEEWEVINAGRVFNIITDYVANGSFASLAENVKYKESEDFAIVVRLTDYKNEYKGPFVYVDKNAYDFLSKSKLEDNDIIIANVGAYAGYVFRAPNINKPITLGPNAILVRSEQNREFIYYLLSSEFGQKAIKDIISTTAQPKFNKTDFKKILLPIPDLKEQYKIASILLEIDEKTEEYEKKKQKLEELKKGLMQQLLTGRIRV